MRKLFLGFLIGIFLCLPQNIFAHSETQVIEMTSNGFKPDQVSLDQNQTVIFINKDKIAHWPASNAHPTHDIYPEFDPQKQIEPGGSWAFKPKKVGEWRYHDHLLPHFRGKIVVVSEGGQSSWQQQFSDFIQSFISKIKSFFPTKKEDGAKRWEDLKLKYKGQSGSTGDIHDQAHLAGSLIFQKTGFGGITICSGEFAFGCYHGFLDQAFKKDLTHLLDAQNACLKLGPENSGPVASCIHGIGHGIASFYSVSEIEKSLASCRNLTSGREFCFDGVFMEFERSAPEDFYKTQDPLYPCSDLERRFGSTYSFACGRNQPTVLMDRFKMEFTDVISICLNSDSDPFKQACFDALGLMVASSGDVSKIIGNCQKINHPDFMVRCIKAGAGELVFQESPGWSEKYKQVCASLDSDQDECLQYVENIIKQYNRKSQISFDNLKGGQDQNPYIREQLKKCYDGGGSDGCYKKVASVFFDQLGLSTTLALFKQNENYPEVYVRCHEVTHYLSRLEYEKQKSISKVYAQCDSTCHGGCYHGTLEAYLKDNPNVEFANICGEKKDYQKPLEYNECLHGLGHAAMFVLDMELKDSLALCDKLPEQDFKERCYTGAFMENSSSSTSFDHQSKYLKADDPFYPCNSLDQKYQPLCWQYQSSYFSIISRQDWHKVANLCLQIPEKYQDRCFRTIGTNQVGFTRSLQTMRDDCYLMPTDHFKDICVSGVVSSLSYRFVGDAKKMIDFCSLVGGQYKEGCFKQMGQGFLDWSKDRDLAKKNCQAIPNQEQASWCLSVM